MDWIINFFDHPFQDIGNGEGGRRVQRSCRIGGISSLSEKELCKSEFLSDVVRESIGMIPTIEGMRPFHNR